MKRRMPILPLLLLGAALSSCSVSWTLPPEGSEGVSNSQGSKGSSSSIAAPEEWKALFDIDNVTVRCVTSFMGAKETTFKHVDGIRYVIYEEGPEAYESDRVLPYDWTAYYASFSYNESSHTYSATNVVRSGPDDDAWEKDVTIKLSDGKISTMNVDSHMASVHIPIAYTFYDYGATTL